MPNGKRRLVPVDLAAPDLSAVLDASRSLRVAVASKKGPHVTPELFVVLDGRIWSFTAASSLKVRVARGSSRVGIAVGGDDRDTDSGGRLVLGANVTVLDPARPIAAVASGFAIDVPRVIAAFASRHAFEIAGGAVDVVLGSFGLVPGRWVLLAFDVDAVAVLGRGGMMRAEGWSPGTATFTPTEDADDADADADDADDAVAIDVPVDAIPSPVRHLLDRDVATLGWNTTSGPIALPVAWDGATSTATVDGGVFTAVGAAKRGPAALTFDEWVAPGPAGKRGVMLRGDGRTEREDGDGRVVVRIEVDRAVAWDGIATSSTSGIRDDPAQSEQTASDSAPNKETRAG
ncbi:MAG TPA: pyridoxamine 5'-phosphate oxidase family protein [Acidimicrobiales bacterium]